MQVLMLIKRYKFYNFSYFNRSKENELNIKATDYEMGLKYKVKNANIQVQGSATANASTLQKRFKRFKR